MAPRPDEPDDGVTPQGADVPDESVPQTDEDAWKGIVEQLGDIAHYDGTADPEADPAPESTPGLDFPVAPWVAERRVVRPAADLSGRDWEGSSQFDEAEATVDAEEHFVPPDPGPVLGGDPLLTMAWIAAAGMPIFLLIVLIAWPHAPTAVIQAAGIVFVLGVAVLLWRMPNRRDPDDDGTGAIV